MKNRIIYTAFILLSVTILNSCYDDNEETLYRFTTPNCDLNNVTYSKTIAPIIQSQCISCHSGITPNGNLNLENHSQVVTAVNSKSLYQRITSKANPMPPSGLMDECSIKQTKKWIDSGMPNN